MAPASRQQPSWTHSKTASAPCLQPLLLPRVAAHLAAAHRPKVLLLVLLLLRTVL